MIRTFLMTILVSAAVYAEEATIANQQNLEFWTNQLQSESPDLQINAIQKVAELKEASTIPMLLAAARDDNPEVRFHAAKALSRIPDRASLEGLEALVATEKDPYVKSEIRRSVKSLTEIFNKAAKPKP